jgi:hypothetical protein
MAQLVKTLATKHRVNLAQRGTWLILTMPARPEQWMIYHYEDGRVSLTRFLVLEDSTCALDLDLVFEIHPLGWEPVELIYDPDFWAAYVQAAEAGGLAVYDGRGKVYFAGFTEYVARLIEAQGWPEQSYKQVEALVESIDLRWVRLPGCQSDHSGSCYGVLWQCAACGKTVCCAEGSDDHPELCDDCWSRHQETEEELDVPF